jgi:hypothetical protein
MESVFYGFETLKLNTMTTEEKELWAKVINDARWYDGTPQMLKQLTEHFNKQGITVKNCSIPNVVGQSEQLVCNYKYHNRDITTNGECTKCESHKWR